MVFSTPYFLFLYLPAVLLLYYISPPEAAQPFPAHRQPAVLRLGRAGAISCIMVLSIAVDYTHGMLVERWQAEGQRQEGPDGRGLVGGVQSGDPDLLQVLGLPRRNLYSRRAGLHAGAGDLTLPIGISFYTFQTMSYTIDVYRGDARVQQNIVNFGTFVTLFPQLIAGPIIKYKDLGEQIVTSRDRTAGKVCLRRPDALWWALARRCCWPTTLGDAVGQL